MEEKIRGNEEKCRNTKSCREACAFFGGVDPLFVTNESQGLAERFAP